MVAALLIGTNVWADQTVYDEAEFLAAFSQSGKVTLGTNIVISASSTDASWRAIWIGSTAENGENGEAKSIVLDMNGHSLTFQAGKSGQVLYPFVLSHGSLKVTGNGTISVEAGAGSIAKGTNVFTVFGTYDKVNPESNPFSHLEIDKDVIVTTVNGTVIAIDALRPGMAQIANTGIDYRTDYYTSSYGLAFGVLVEVRGTLSSISASLDSKCYAVKVNGYVACPGGQKPENPNSKYSIRSPHESYFSTYSLDDVVYAPYVKIYGTAKLSSTSDYNTSNKDAGSAAVYASGYGRWYIAGECKGATGVYVSSGDVAVADSAKIASNATSYIAPTGSGHANGQGSGLVVNSRDSYSGQIDIAVTGDAEVSSNVGYAVEEAVNTTVNPETEKSETKVENISISGGTFTGGTDPVTHEAQPAIIVTAASKDSVAVYGGNVVNGAQVGAEGGLSELIPQTAHTTTVVIDNKPVTVISEGAAPEEIADLDNIEAGDTASVKLTATEETILAGTTVTLAELEMNQNVNQTLTIQSGAVLEVGRAILGEKAQIIVEPGAKFIVYGEQGFVASKASNFILRSSENNPAIFLFHPAVTSNRHPKATVEFLSKSCYRYPTYKNIYQRFGIPMEKDGLESISTPSHETRFFAFDESANEWKGIGYINPSTGYEGDPLDITKLNDPFAYYQLLDFTATTPDAGATYTMVGNLLGNGEPTMEILEHSWKGFANSYMGKVSLAELLALIPNTVDKAIYTYDITAAAGTWEPVTNLNVKSTMINPMQPFLIRNRHAAANVELDYEAAVYNPTLGIQKSNAPRRAATDNITMAKITIANGYSRDYVIVAEDADFSAEFDNGYDAAKFMNEGINMYVSADEKMSIFATDNLANTYVGFQSVEGGNYTMEFADVQGEELILIDHETGARVAMVEGAMYEFTAAANTVNDYRFEIVEPAKMPTAIENTEAVKSAKGIYTITGQYMGEMNVWNTLPAGVYVVNGEKLVK